MEDYWWYVLLAIVVLIVILIIKNYNPPPSPTPAGVADRSPEDMVKQSYCDGSTKIGGRTCYEWAQTDTKTQYGLGLPGGVPVVYPPDVCWLGDHCGIVKDPRNP